MNTLQTDLTTVFDRLTQLATLEAFWQRFETIYGKEYNADLAEALCAQWAGGDFSQVPAIEVVSGEVLGQALGAYAASLNKIYLSESFLAKATLAQITAVILEEIGHFVDAQINATDTPGDEGELFATLVLGSPLSHGEWQRLRQENDLCTVTIDGQEVALEQASFIKSGIFPTTGSDPGNLTNVNGTLYFSADDGVNGRELWKSDGTPEGTFLFKDIAPGRDGSYPSSLTKVNDTFYFTADDGVNGRELWKSDGTTAGTVLVRDINSLVIDINSGSDSSDPWNLINVNGILYFTADDGVNGRELWKTDGTTAGTVLVKDINPGVSSSSNSPESLTNINGTLYFTANDGVNGRELWKSSGTDTSTFLVRDILPGAIDSYYAKPDNLINVNGTLYFTTDDGVHGVELWKSDGTTEGTLLVTDLNPGSGSTYPGFLSNVNGTLYFVSRSWQYSGSRWYPSLGFDGRLWKSNGTSEGTVLIKSIVPSSGSYSSYYYYFNLANINDILYFPADDKINGWELWKSDGTPEGTILVTDINPGSGSSDPRNLTNVNDILYLIAGDGSNGRELWKSDGTPKGTVLVTDINPGSGSSDPGNLTHVNDTLYFSADDGVNGRELWKSDGTAASTNLVRNINNSNASKTLFFTQTNNALYFVTNDGANGRELWKSDGTPEGTVLVKDIVPGPGGSNPEKIIDINGTLYFTANDSSKGWELWKSDGTPEGTVLFKDINRKADGVWIPVVNYELFNFNNTLYFTADRVNHQELWKSDGTPEGTVLVKDVSYVGDLTNVNGTLYFTAHDGVNGIELWKSDGTSEGTILVKDINSGFGSSSPRGLTNVNGTLFFAADDGDGNEELWKSDGTPEGTVLVKDIAPGDGFGNRRNSSPMGLTNVNGILYFMATANDGSLGWDIWKSDGTPEGTVLVKDMEPSISEGYSYPIYPNVGDLTNINGTLYFTADDGVNGWELWKSDGTAAGTVLVKDINPDVDDYGQPNSLGPSNLTDVDGTLYFTADDGVNGRKIWTTDGTTAGTVIADMALLPSDLVSFLGRLFFTAVDPDGDGRGLQALNQAPTDISLNKLTIGKNLPTGSIVAFLSSTDPDGDNAFSYSLVAGAGDSDNSAFTIDSNTLKLAVSPGDTTQSSFSIRVKTTDLGGLSYEEIFTLAVTDADGAGIIPSLSIQDAVMREGHSGQQDLTFTVRLSQPTSQAVRVDYSTADQTALALPDYDFTRDVLTIPARQTEAQIRIPIRGDTLDEPSETFVVNLSNAIGATLLDSQAIGTIEQDDTLKTPLVFKGGMLQIAYVACYGRPGDPGGLAFWNKVFGDSKVVFGGGDELTGDEVGLFNTLTKAFGEGPEATQLFGSLTSVQKVNQVYNMAFNRDAEPEGLNFWTSHLDAGNITPANLGIYIALGAVDGDIITLRNKIASADLMSKAIDTPLETQAISTPAYADFGRSWLAPLGDTSASLYAAETALTNSGLF